MAFVPFVVDKVGGFSDHDKSSCNFSENLCVADGILAIGFLGAFSDCLTTDQAPPCVTPAEAGIRIFQALPDSRRHGADEMSEL